MKILPIQDVYQRKFNRQRSIKELSYHAAGHCVHLGKISPGCYACYMPDFYSNSIDVGTKCNLDCLYCCEGRTVRGRKIDSETSAAYLRQKMKKALSDSEKPDYQPSSICFSGIGEPLMHPEVISSFMHFFLKLHKKLKKKPWYFLYSNGILANNETLLKLRDLGFDEVRFHLGATNFSEAVYKNMSNAVKYFKAVSVETPAWPPHRKKLFEMLPRIEDIGIKHVDIIEIKLNRFNFARISTLLPEGEICQCGELQLYDGGLVYDLIEEVIKKRYSYSVLDCNCFVKNFAHTSGRWVFHEGVDGLCAEYD